MSTHAAPRSRLRRAAALLPAARGWWLVLGAVLAGLLLSMLALSGKRERIDLAAPDAAPGEPGRPYQPLPAPLAAADSAASGMDTQSDAADEAPPIDRHAGAPAPLPDQVEPSAPAEDQSPAPDAPAAADASVPRLLSAPPPEYPLAALRAGQSGNVVLQIEVRANGRTGAVSVVESSGHRALDRAAANAVRRWRFEPAQRDGHPVATTVQQSISFDAPR